MIVSTLQKNHHLFLKQFNGGQEGFSVKSEEENCIVPQADRYQDAMPQSCCK